MNEADDARCAVGKWHLGQTSARYESGGHGAGAISSGTGDHGGVSYGSYQLSLKMGTLAEYLQQSSYGELFRGLRAGTAAFDEKWRALAKADPGFGRDQHDFIGRSHYEEQLSKLGSIGLELSNRGRAVQDAIWSTSVQFRGLTPKIFVGGLTEKFGRNFELAALTDSQIIEAVQDFKIVHNASLFKSSPEWQASLLRRANEEKKDLLRLASQERMAGIAYPSPSTAPAALAGGAKEHDAHLTGRISDVERFRVLQTELRHLGYRDEHGRLLSPDGISGHNTTHAIKSFQHAHHLHVDGIAGPRTLAALEEAKLYPLLSEATNPHHAMYQQVLHGIRALPRDQQPTGRQLENAAVALTIAAHGSGLHQIDHVVIGSNGVNLFAVQGRMHDPAHRRVHVELAHAVVHAPDHRSMTAAQPAPEHLHAQAVAQQQAAPRAPVMAVP